MNKLNWILYLLISMCSLQAYSQHDSDEFKNWDDLDIVTLLKESVYKKPTLKFEESPGILTEITREEFTRRGARELMDIIRMIPGLEFSQNFNNLLSVGYQGIAGHQGKVILLIDNIEMNDAVYGTIAWAQHFPIDMIERIEIIKGSGSIVLNGNQTLCTINIITRSGDKLQGANFSLYSGSYDSSYSRRGVTFLMGDKISRNKSWTIIGGFSTGKLTNVALPNMVPWESRCNLNDVYVMAKLKLKTWDFNYVLNNYSSEATVLQSSSRYFSQSFQITNQYKIPKSDWSIIPLLNINQMIPMSWLAPGFQQRVTPALNIKNNNAQLRLLFKHSFEDNIIKSHSYFGIEYKMGNEIYYNKKQTIGNFQNTVLYAQNLLQRNLSRKNINRLLIKSGIRADIQQNQKLAVSPKIGIEYNYKNFTINAFGGSFQVNPNNYNTFINAGLKQENIKSGQLKLGYKQNNYNYISVNSYLNQAKNIITYNQIGYILRDTFFNDALNGTKGIEVEMSYRFGERFFFNSYYSYYTRTNKNQSSSYVALYEKSNMLGFAKHKITGSLQYNLTTSYWLNLNAQYYSKVYGIDAFRNLETQKNMLMLDLHFNYTPQNAPVEVQAGLYNILNKHFKYYQNIIGGNNVGVPGGGRELSLKIIFNLSFYDNQKEPQDYINSILF